MALYLDGQKVASGGQLVQISAASIPGGVNIANLSIDGTQTKIYAPSAPSISAGAGLEYRDGKIQLASGIYALIQQLSAAVSETIVITENRIP